MTAPARFKPADITRALKGAKAADWPVGRIEIDPNGKIVILSETAAPPSPGTSWDDVT